MSLAKIFGGGKKKEAAPTTQDAIQKLRGTEDLLQKKSSHLELKITAELKAARAAGTKNKRVALNALKRKKRLEKQLQQIDGTLSTIEFQREALENANTNTEVLKAMGFAAKAMKSAHQELNVDDVHDMMDDISEQTELANEISDAISSSVGFQDVDEDDLMAELEDLEQETLDEQMLNLGGTASAAELPSVPETELPKAEKKKIEEDDDMKELAAWAN